MNFTAPQAAPARGDLPWLRRRALPTRAAAPAPAAPAPVRNSALADFINGSSGRRTSTPGPTPATPSVLTPSVPTPSVRTPSSSDTSLDLSVATPAPTGPAAPPAAVPAAPQTSGGTSLDLGAAPEPAPAAAFSADVTGSTSLDLSPSTTTATSTAPAAPTTPTPGTRGYQPPRVRAGAPVTLTRHDPTVTLTRLQSGIGALLIEAACSDAVGDLRLGVAYQLRDGSSSIAVRADGLATAPKGSARPFVRVHRDRFESVTLDLVQIRDIERVIVFAHSPSGQQLRWAGTATVTTSGQARIESPLTRSRNTAFTVSCQPQRESG